MNRLRNKPATTLRNFASTLALMSILVAVFQATAIAGKTNQLNQAATNNCVATNFVADAVLTPNEVKQVLELAKKCGIARPSEVGTFHYLPTGGRGISVKSVELVDERNTSFDTVIISKKGWHQFTSETNSIQLDSFWAAADAKYSTLLRSYEFRKTTIQVSIGKGIEVALADKVIPLIDAKKARFENDWARRQVEELKDSKPVAIYKSYSGNGYELRFNEPSMRAIMFDLKDGRVVITGVAIINI